MYLVRRTLYGGGDQSGNFRRAIPPLPCASVRSDWLTRGSGKEVRKGQEA